MRTKGFSFIDIYSREIAASARGAKERTSGILLPERLTFFNFERTCLLVYR